MAQSVKQTKDGQLWLKILSPGHNPAVRKPTAVPCNVVTVVVTDENRCLCVSIRLNSAVIRISRLRRPEILKQPAHRRAGICKQFCTFDLFFLFSSFRIVHVTFFAKAHSAAFFTCEPLQRTLLLWLLGVVSLLSFFF